MPLPTVWRSVAQGPVFFNNCFHCRRSLFASFACLPCQFAFCHILLSSTTHESRSTNSTRLHQVHLPVRHGGCSTLWASKARLMALGTPTYCTKGSAVELLSGPCLRSSCYGVVTERTAGSEGTSDSVQQGSPTSVPARLQQWRALPGGPRPSAAKLARLHPCHNSFRQDCWQTGMESFLTTVAGPEYTSLRSGQLSL